MKIWLTRHGQTNLNKCKVMQGHIDEPLNDIGRQQARDARSAIGDMKFDAVISSPLIRAVETASIIGNVPEEEIIKDERIIEFNFGKFENVEYSKMGLPMILFWLCPEIFPCPKEMEQLKDAIARVQSFLNELKTKDYDNVLVVCHGGIIRVLNGVLEGRRNNIKWRPRPENCEIRIFEV